MKERALALEFAHFAILPSLELDNLEDVHISSEYALDLYGSINYPIQTQILIDDKRYKSTLDSELYAAIICKWLPKELKLDAVTLESELQMLSTQYYDTISVKSRRRIVRKFSRYSAASGFLACSQDIAVWHSVRAGLIRPEKLTVLGNEGVVPASVLVSILPHRNKEFEDLAMRDYLDCSVAAPWDDVIFNFYYPDNADFADVASPHWIDFKERINEAIAKGRK